MNTQSNPYRHSRGFTLVELMVGLVITSILVLGAGGFLEAAHQSNNVRTAVSGLNANGRFGLSQIARDIRMSGYRASDWHKGGITNPVVAVDGAAVEGGDSVGLTYEAARDCAFVAGAGTTVTNTYRVTDNQLQCNGQTIATGVEQMQVYFGWDTNNDNVANRWVAPGTAGLDMRNVSSIRIHLLTVTAGNQVASVPQAYYFDGAAREPVGDGQIRREYSMTVAVRNQF